MQKYREKEIGKRNQRRWSKFSTEVLSHTYFLCFKTGKDSPWKPANSASFHLNISVERSCSQESGELHLPMWLMSAGPYPALGSHPQGCGRPAARVRRCHVSPWEQLEPHSSRAAHSSPMGFCSSEEVLFPTGLRKHMPPNQSMVSNAYFLY